VKEIASGRSERKTFSEAGGKFFYDDPEIVFVEEGIKVKEHLKGPEGRKHEKMNSENEVKRKESSSTTIRGPSQKNLVKKASAKAVEKTGEWHFAEEQ